MPAPAALPGLSRVEILDPLADTRWGELLDRAPEALIFHHPAWLRLVCGEYGYPLSAWALTAPDGSLVAALPVALLRSRLTGTRLISVPFTETCPPLVDPASSVTTEELTRELDAERARRGLSLEVRAELPPGAGAVITRTFVRHLLALEPDVAAVQGRFRPQVRRGIAKARREGVSIERRADADGLARFYRLHRQTRRRQGLPTQSRRLVMRFAELFAQGLGFVLLARQAGRDVAAGVFLTSRGTLTYEFGASDHERLRSRPNNLLFMEAIEWGCANGHHTLDFGRTDLDNRGLLAFKASWGAEPSPLRYCRLGGGAAGPSAGAVRDVLAPVIRRAPAGFGQLVGTALYRHLG